MKQIGVLGTLEDKQDPFFIEWKSINYLSKNGKAVAEIVKIKISVDEKTIEEGLGSDLSRLLMVLKFSELIQQ